MPMLMSLTEDWLVTEDDIVLLLLVVADELAIELITELSIDILDDTTSDDVMATDITLDDDVMIILDDVVADVVITDDITILDDDNITLDDDNITLDDVMTDDNIDEDIDGISVEELLILVVVDMLVLTLKLLLLLITTGDDDREVVTMGLLIIKLELVVTATHEPPLLMYPSMQPPHARPLYGAVQLHPTPSMPSSHGTMPLHTLLDTLGQAIDQKG